MLSKELKVGEEVKLLAYVNTVQSGFELSPGDVGTISAIDEEAGCIRIDVVYTNANPNSPYGEDHEDYLYVFIHEIEDYLEDYFHIEEN